ncbi:Hypothetical protein FKW44_022721, partial [Caligus rogercresseyi]
GPQGRAIIIIPRGPQRDLSHLLLLLQRLPCPDIKCSGKLCSSSEIHSIEYHRPLIPLEDPEEPG